MLEAKDTKKCDANAKDSPSEVRHSRCQGQVTRGQEPRTQTKNKAFKNFFKAISKKRSSKIFLGDHQKKKNGREKEFSAHLQNFIIQKTVLSTSRGQGNFRGLKASKDKDFKMGPGGLHLCKMNH